MWYYVYVLKLKDGRHYVGRTKNLKDRMRRHSSGHSQFTKCHLPIILVWAASFSDLFMAIKFEKYLKSGSGRAFTKKRLVKTA